MRALESLVGVCLLGCAGVADFNVVGMQCMLVTKSFELDGAAIYFEGKLRLLQSLTANAEVLVSDKAGRTSVNFKSVSTIDRLTSVTQPSREFASPTPVGFAASARAECAFIG